MEFYYLSDKYISKSEKGVVTVPVKIDRIYHTYEFIIPPNGTNLNGLVIKFPNIPIEAEIRSLSLEYL